MVSGCALEEEVATREITILVVDDDADMRMLARAVLQRAGITVAAEAADGPSALSEFHRLNPPPIPTVILLDNQMPGLTGLEVAAQVLRRLPDQLIVLFSAYLDDAMMAEAQAIGIAACISKSEALDLGAVVRELVNP